MPVLLRVLKHALRRTTTGRYWSSVLGCYPSPLDYAYVPPCYLASDVRHILVYAQHHLCDTECATPAELQHLLSSVAALDLALQGTKTAAAAAGRFKVAAAAAAASKCTCQHWQGLAEGCVHYTGG